MARRRGSDTPFLILIIFIAAIFLSQEDPKRALEEGSKLRSEFIILSRILLNATRLSWVYRKSEPTVVGLPRSHEEVLYTLLSTQALGKHSQDDDEYMSKPDYCREDKLSFYVHSGGHNHLLEFPASLQARMKSFHSKNADDILQRITSDKENELKLNKLLDLVRSTANWTTKQPLIPVNVELSLLLPGMEIALGTRPPVFKSKSLLPEWIQVTMRHSNLFREKIARTRTVSMWWQSLGDGIMKCNESRHFLLHTKGVDELPVALNTNEYGGVIFDGTSVPHGISFESSACDYDVLPYIEETTRITYNKQNKSWMLESTPGQVIYSVPDSMVLRSLTWEYAIQEELKSGTNDLTKQEVLRRLISQLNGADRISYKVHLVSEQNRHVPKLQRKLRQFILEEFVAMPKLGFLERNWLGLVELLPSFLQDSCNTVLPIFRTQQDICD
eukprot:m.33156 g.33156  ORF g.33156 m.33156 type:complete len:444 (+) comp8498_c1_seq1:193-1524(+)